MEEKDPMMFVSIVLLVICIIMLHASRERDNKNYQVLQSRVLNDITYKNPNPIIFITTQMCEYENNKGFGCPWDFETPYEFIRTEKKDEEIFLIVCDNNRERRIHFSSIRIDEKFMNFKTIEYGCPNLDEYGTFFDEDKEYPFFVHKDKKIYIDNLGNQVTQ